MQRDCVRTNVCSYLYGAVMVNGRRAGRQVWRALRHPSWLMWKTDLGEPGFEHDHLAYGGYANCMTWLNGEYVPYPQFCDAHFHRSRLYHACRYLRARYQPLRKALVALELVLVTVTAIVVITTSC